MQETLARDVLVDADYSQFYLWWGDGVDGDFTTGGEGSGLLHHVDDRLVLLCSPVQYGNLTIRVEVLDATPEPLGAEWDDVTELSLSAPGDLFLAGWDRSSLVTSIPVPEGDIRIRYAIAGTGDWDALDPSRLRLRLDLWPAPVEPPAAVRSSAGFGRYWHGNHAIDQVLAGESILLGDSEELFRDAVRRILRDAPGIRDDLLAGGRPAEWWRDRLTSGYVGMFGTPEGSRRMAILDDELADG